jgi:inosine/xanthosine triphosphatase
MFTSWFTNGEESAKNKIMHIFVGSTNPVKINAVINAASGTWPDVVVIGINVPSGIEEQPMSDKETRMGAQNRAMAVLQAGLQQYASINKTEALGIGLEGGVFVDDENNMWSTVWIAVTDHTRKFWESNGARFPVPQIIAEKIQAGGEMGPIVTQLVGEADVRQKQGMIGVITNNFVDRTEEYTSITKMALGLWYGQDWINIIK